MQKRERVFDNGITTASYAQATLKGAQALVVSFDHLGAFDVDAPGFGEEFLLKNGFDVLSIQKRKENYYQDFSRDEFRKLIVQYSERYPKIVLYGSSLGGYAALFYSSGLICSVVAISPLCSIHPRHTNEAARSASSVEWRHEPTTVDAAAGANCVILTDPYDRFDAEFLQRVICPAFPNAKIGKVFFGGHPVGETLLELGILKSTVLSAFATGNIPALSTVGKKSQSKSILCNIVNVALKRNKISAALSAAQKLFDMDEKSLLYRMHLSRVLLKAGRLTEAAALADTVHADYIAPSGEPRRLPSRSEEIRPYFGHFIELGKAFFEMKKFREAQHYYGCAVAMNSSMSWWKYMYATALFENQKYEEAINVLVGGTRLPEHAEAWQLLGRCYATIGSTKDATLAYSRAHEMRPEWVWPLIQIASLQLNPEGKPELGISVLQRFDPAGKSAKECSSVFVLKARLHERAAFLALSKAREFEQVAVS